MNTTTTNPNHGETEMTTCTFTLEFLSSESSYRLHLDENDLYGECGFLHSTLEDAWDQAEGLRSHMQAHGYDIRIHWKCPKPDWVTY